MRRRMTKADVVQLERQVIEVLAADAPLSIRHIFYRLTDTRLPLPIEKSERGYQIVQRRTVEMRRSGKLPYGHISDTSRAGYHVPQYDNASAFVRAVSGLYRGPLWTADLPHVEVWAESRSIASVLRETCKELAVSLYPTGGYSSLTLIYAAAQHINALGRSQAAVLYVGDFDAAGLDIPRALEADLRQHLAIPLTFRRLAITEAQIAAHSLPTKPRKATERRRPEIQATVEAEALPAPILRQLVRDAVEAYLPQGHLEAVKAAEASEREALLLPFMT